jgi:CHASE3 domain sensor protein
MTIGKKITFGFLSVLGISVSLGIFSYCRLVTIDHAVSAVIEDALPSIETLGTLVVHRNSIEG